MTALAQEVAPAIPVVGEEVPFPLVPIGAYSERGVEFTSSSELLRELDDAESLITMSGVTVPTATGYDVVSLQLKPVEVIPAHALLFIDGRRAGTAEDLRAGFRAFGGRIAGELNSDVFIAFTSTGAMGWVDRAGGMSHLFSLAADGGDWSQATSVLLHEHDPLLADGFKGIQCTGAVLVPNSSRVDPEARANTQTGLLECFVSVETDFQFYELFNDATAATNYALALMGAVSVRFDVWANTHISVPYLGIHTNSNDGWNSENNDTSSMLSEFRSAWQGNIPNGGNLGHFISAADLGGGRAYLDVLCDSSFGFGVSGNLHGQTPIPVPSTGPLTWDFYVVAHELGHNFSANHTHEYCPPIDECAPPQYFGTWQDEQLCQAGTIMSYCHLCTGGMDNIITQFHPTVALDMSNAAANSCLGRCGQCAAVANFEASPLSGFSPLSVEFTDLSYGGVTSWSWNFGDGNTSTQRHPTHVYQNGGMYTVELMVSGTNGSDVLTRTNYITVNDPIPPLAEFSGAPLCGVVPLTVSFSDESTGDLTSWSWDFGDGSMNPNPSPFHTFQTAGTYTVTLTVTGPGGSDSEMKRDYVVAKAIDAPVADFVGFPTLGEAPLLVSFFDLSTGNITNYSWTFGDGGTSSLQSPSNFYLNEGDYTVSLTVTGPGGSDTETKVDYIGVHPLAEVTYRNANGINFDILTSNLPKIGTDWVATIDAGSAGHTGLTFMFGYEEAFFIPVPLPFGELLIDVGSGFVLSSAEPTSSGSSVHTAAVPPDVSLVGHRVYTQGYLNAGPIKLTNSADLLIGY